MAHHYDLNCIIQCILINAGVMVILILFNSDINAVSILLKSCFWPPQLLFFSSELLLIIIF